MALKRLKNGTFEIKTKKQAAEAFKLSQELADTIRELEKEHGLDEMRVDSTELHRSATRYMASKGIKALKIPGLGKVAKLIQGGDSRWAETKADLKDAPPGTRSLRAIVGADVWKQITTRRLDPDKLQEAVQTGIVDEEEIEKAYYEKPRSPYVRIYDE